MDNLMNPIFSSEENRWNDAQFWLRTLDSINSAMNATLQNMDLSLGSSFIHKLENNLPNLILTIPIDLLKCDLSAE
jgi:hypothetical protein